MYFASRKVSLPSIEFMMKKENEMEDEEQGSSKDMYIEFSQRLNELINLYFSATKKDDIEAKIAGNQEERALMMPLLYIDKDEQLKK